MPKTVLDMVSNVGVLLFWTQLYICSPIGEPLHLFQLAQCVQLFNRSRFPGTSWSFSCLHWLWWGLLVNLGCTWPLRRLFVSIIAIPLLVHVLHRADAMCMVWPWLCWCGFADLVFLTLTWHLGGQALLFSGHYKGLSFLCSASLHFKSLLVTQPHATWPDHTIKTRLFRLEVYCTPIIVISQ